MQPYLLDAQIILVRKNLAENLLIPALQMVLHKQATNIILNFNKILIFFKG
jgi:hypothetical protein